MPGVRPILHRRLAVLPVADHRPVIAVVPRGRGLKACVMRAAIRDLEPERRTLFRIDELQVPSVHADDLRGDRKPKPGATLALRAGERLEQMVVSVRRRWPEKVDRPVVAMSLSMAQVLLMRSPSSQDWPPDVKLGTPAQRLNRCSLSGEQVCHVCATFRRVG